MPVTKGKLAPSWDGQARQARAPRAALRTRSKRKRRRQLLGTAYFATVKNHSHIVQLGEATFSRLS